MSIRVKALAITHRNGAVYVKPEMLRVVITCCLWNATLKVPRTEIPAES